MSYCTQIRAGKKWWSIPWIELFEYRDLFWLLIKRDLTAIYKQTVLGPLWFVIQPLVTTVVFTVIFGHVASVPTDDVPPFIFYMCGTIFWTYFQGCMNNSAMSLIGNANLYSKVYFPRLIIPFVGLVVNLAHFLLNFLLFALFYFYYVFILKANIVLSSFSLLFIFVVLQCAMAGIGIGLWIAALTTKYRDLRFALPLLTQLWMYVTPVVYPISLVENPLYRNLLWMNPMSFPIELSRLLLTGSGTVSLQGGLISWGITFLLLITGILVFNLVERTFVDTI